MDHVEISPANVVGNDNGGFSLGQVVARHGDYPSIENLEDGLDPIPIGECNKGGRVVDTIREEVAKGEEERADEVHKDEFECPW